MSTEEKLAQRLREIGLFGLADRAEIGEFSDFESPHAMPKVKLVEVLTDLSSSMNLSWEKKVGTLITEVMLGKWDDTREEAEAWYQKEGKDLLK